MTTYSEIMTGQSLGMPLIVAFLPILGTLINAYAVLFMVLSNKDIRGVWVFIGSHVLVLISSFIIASFYVSSVTIEDAGLYPMLVKIGIFLIALNVPKDGITGWEVLGNRDYNVGEAEENLSLNKERQRLSLAGYKPRKIDFKFLVKVLIAVGFLYIGYLIALGNRYEQISDKGVFLDTWTGKIYNGYNGKPFGKIE